MFHKRTPAKQPQETIARPQITMHREGEFSLTLMQPGRLSIDLSLSIHSSVPERHQSIAAPVSQPHARVRTLYTTSYLLRQCYTYFHQDSPSHERQLLVSGICLDEDTYVLDIIVPVKLDKASRYGVAADLGDLFSKLVLLEETHGLLLLGIFHSHLWEGRSAVQPSDTDQTLQNNLEQEGYKTVQAIFSKDALVGFFTNSIPFVLNVIGNDVTEVETHAIQRVVQLTDVPHLSYQTI